MLFCRAYKHFEYLKRKSVILKLAIEAIAYFHHGGLSDSEQQNIIEDFGKQDSAVKYCYVLMQVLRGKPSLLCNQMFNYDIPWSLITLEQRNGRIDRYGENTIYSLHRAGY
jgi:SNF2 family DNA or RNA helicase